MLQGSVGKFLECFYCNKITFGEFSGDSSEFILNSDFFFYVADDVINLAVFPLITTYFPVMWFFDFLLM